MSGPVTGAGGATLAGGPVREDLLVLTPQALASLANVGLLKRAEKDLAQGRGPQLEVDAEGALAARFEDGARVRLLPGRGLRDSPCTACSTPACRHRLLAVLAYQEAARAAAARAAASSTSERPGPSGDAADPPGGDGLGAQPGAMDTREPPALAPPPWSPAEAGDDALERLLGAAAMERARGARRRGVLAEVRRGTFEGDDLPVVHLATSTVRFLVPRELGYARCDCTLRTGCEHVALAVWAFREAARKDPGAKVVSVEVSLRSPEEVPLLPAALGAALDLAVHVLLEGAAHLPEAAATRFAVARAALDAAGLTWPLVVVDDVEVLVDAYRQRSARYSAERLAQALSELFARARAAAGRGELPARFVLGSDEVLEAKLDQLRLTGLGARVTADGADRQVELMFADPRSSGVFVLRRSYVAAEGVAPEDGPTLSRRVAVASTPLAALATGQLVSSGAVRRANRLLTFASGPLQKTSVLRGAFELERLPAGLVVSDVDVLAKELADRLPRVLRPRVLAENVRVVRIGSVAEVAYDEAEQRVWAACRDPAGGTFTVELGYRSVAPGALAAVAHALSSGSARAVVGEVSRREAGLVVEPIAIAATRLIVPDFEAEVPGARVLLARLPERPVPRATDRHGVAVARASSRVDEVAHHGLRALGPTWSERLRASAAELGEVGLLRLRGLLEELEERAAAARATGAEPDERRAAEAWATAAIALELAATRGPPASPADRESGSRG